MSVSYNYVYLGVLIPVLSNTGYVYFYRKTILNLSFLLMLLLQEMKLQAEAMEEIKKKLERKFLYVYIHVVELSTSKPNSRSQHSTHLY